MVQQSHPVYRCTIAVLRPPLESVVRTKAEVRQRRRINCRQPRFHAIASKGRLIRCTVVVVSMPCRCRNRSTPAAWISDKKATRSWRLRPRRSTDQAITTSNSRRAAALWSASRRAARRCFRCSASLPSSSVRSSKSGCALVCPDRHQIRTAAACPYPWRPRCRGPCSRARSASQPVLLPGGAHALGWRWSGQGSNPEIEDCALHDFSRSMKKGDHKAV
jgi:hypothetical protein